MDKRTAEKKELERKERIEKQRMKAKQKREREKLLENQRRAVVMREIEKLGREVICLVSCLKPEATTSMDKATIKALLKTLQEYEKRITDYYRQQGIGV